MCGKTFQARRSLFRHLRKAHGRSDYRELVPPSYKSVFDVNRLRNEKGRFVRVDEVSSTVRNKRVALETNTDPQKQAETAKRKSIPPTVMYIPTPVWIMEPRTGQEADLRSLGQLSETVLVPMSSAFTVYPHYNIRQGHLVQYPMQGHLVQYPMQMPNQAHITKHTLERM